MRVPSRWLKLVVVTFASISIQFAGLQSPTMRLGNAAFGAEETEPAETKVDYPLATLSVASVNRLLQNVDYMFESADRPELAEIVVGLLANVNDLKGLDMDRPFGAVVYLANLVMPEVIGYVPVKDLDELRHTLESQQGTLTETEVENRFELEVRTQQLFVRIVDGYAFIARNDASLERNFPDPAGLTKGLSSRFDVGVTISLDNVSQTRRTLFLQFLRAGMMAQLQKRDKESESRYRRRRAEGERQLRFFERLLTDGQDFTGGVVVSPSAHNAQIEFSLNARPGSKFADYLSAFVRKKSLFANLATARTPLTATMSTGIQEQDRKYYKEQLDFVRDELKRILNGEETPVEDPDVNDLIEPLSGTVEHGHIDAVIQLRGQPPDAFVLIAGLKITGGERLARGAAGILRRIQDKLKGVDLTLNAESRQGVSFHRISSKTPIVAAQALFGADPSLYVGVAPNAIWLVIGGEDAMPTVEAAIEAVAQPPKTPNVAPATAPFELVVNLSSWLGLLGDRQLQNAAGRAALEAFSGKTDDAIRIEEGGTENGVRYRITFEEGCVRFLGLLFASRIDRRNP